MRFQTLYEGRLFFLIFIGLLVLSGVFGWSVVGFIAFAGFVFCLNFFRDPDRPVPSDERAIVAAADGVVADIIEIEENEVLKTKCRRIGIFLSVFDVHVNKAPIAGKVIYQNHFPGTYPGPFLDARKPDCSKFNEALTWAFEGKRVTIVVRQITGAIARRIVPWSKIDDEVEKGFRFGMIRFGSRTEVFIPLDADVTVNLGDKVLGAQTVIARLPKLPNPLFT
jgi:phosphatidylserine decarboxylase